MSSLIGNAQPQFILAADDKRTAPSWWTDRFREALYSPDGEMDYGTDFWPRSSLSLGNQGVDYGLQETLRYFRLDKTSGQYGAIPATPTGNLGLSSEVLLPESAGSYTEWGEVFGAATHWEALHEQTADNNDSTIFDNTHGGTERDTFTLTPSAMTEINSLSIYAVAARDWGSGAAYGGDSNDVRVMLRTYPLPVLGNRSTTAASGTSVTVTHVVDAGNDRLLVVCVGFNPGAAGTITGVTYAGAALTRLGGVVNGTTVASDIWYLVAPAVGTDNIVITASPSLGAIYCNNSNWTGVDQTTPMGTVTTATGTDNTPTVTVANATPTAVVIDSAAQNPDGATATTMTPGTGQTTILAPTANPVGFDVGSSFEPGAASVVMDWVSNNSDPNHPWATTAAPIFPSGVDYQSDVKSLTGSRRDDDGLWVEVSETWATNPATGQAWTTAEIATIEVGVRNAMSGAGGGGVAVSQVRTILNGIGGSTSTIDGGLTAKSISKAGLVGTLAAGLLTGGVSALKVKLKSLSSSWTGFTGGVTRLFGRTIEGRIGNDDITMSAGVITDAKRILGVEHDGPPVPDKSYGFWPSTTNLCENGGLEFGAVGWSTAGSNTVAASLTQHKFGAASLKCTYQNNQLMAAVSADVQDNYNYFISMWVYVPSNWDGTDLEPDTDIGYGWSGDFIDLTKRDQWQRCVFHATASATETVQFRIYEFGTPTAGRFIYIDGVQVETNSGDVPSPYVDTNDATASRSTAGTVDADNVLNSTQGWVAARVRPTAVVDFSSARSLFALFDNPSTNGFFLNYTVADGFYFEYDNGFEFDGVPFGYDITDTTIGNLVTVIAAWTATELKLSVNGEPFVTVARAAAIDAIPDGTLMNIGHDGFGDTLNGEMYWFVAGTGTLGDSDAEALHSLGNTDPQLSQFLTKEPVFMLNCDFAQDQSGMTGTLAKGFFKVLEGTLAAGNLVGSVAKKVFVNSLSGVLAAGNLIGSVVASKFKSGAASLRGSGTIIISGLSLTPIQGGRLYIEIYDSLGNKLGSGPIFQIQRFSFTKRLDRGGEFEFQIPASDDRAVLINQGREIRVFREGEGEIYRGVIEKAMWGVSD